MWSRRSVIAALVAAPLLGIAGPGRAPAPPTWWVGDSVGAPAPGTIVAERFGAKPVLARTRTKVVPREVDLISANNANTEFTMWVVFPRQADDREVFLSADGSWFAAGSFGHDDTGSQASFQVDRATALRLARVLKLALNERTRLDEGLQWSWTFPPRASTRPADPISVTLHVKNASPRSTMGFVIGGRQRGPRDNRFVFTIARNGTPIAIKDAPDFGGISYYKALKPGESTDLSIDLRSWADLSLPGHYEIDARYEGELAKDGVMPTTAADRKNVWDIALTGTGGILVQ